MKKFRLLHAVWMMILALSLAVTPDSAMAAKKRITNPTPSPTPAPTVEATWVWNTYQIVNEKDQLLQFAKSNGVNLIYLQVLPGEITQDQYRTFIREAGLNGIAVQALDGRPEWALAENRYHVTDLVNWVKQYNASVAVEERFRGIHLDVEPYILPQWSTDQSTVVTAWMDTVKLFISQVRTDSTLKATSDIPSWLEHISVPNNGGTLSRFMISQYDQVTLMAYRDVAEGSDGIIEIVKNELAEANALGKGQSVIVGVNIIADPEGDMVSFAEEGKAEMERQISIFYTALKGYASFAGHAVHDYSSWRNALP